jgi:hypothetical protein
MASLSQVKPHISIEFQCANASTPILRTATESPCFRSGLPRIPIVRCHLSIPIPHAPSIVPKVKIAVLTSLCHFHLKTSSFVLHAFSRSILRFSLKAYVKAIAPFPGPASFSDLIDRAPLVRRRKVSAYGTPDAVKRAAVA